MIDQRYFAAALAATLLAAVPAHAFIVLGGPLAEHMVLQQGVPLAIWARPTVLATRCRCDSSDRC